MIQFNLDALLEKRNVSRYWLSKQTGTDYNTIKSIANNEHSRISLEMIERIVVALDCDFNDLFVRK